MPTIRCNSRQSAIVRDLQIFHLELKKYNTHHTRVQIRRVNIL